MSHPGQAEYSASSGELYEPYSSSWKLDANNGWRFCGLSLDECREACVGMGACAEVNVASNGCCFPARQRCVGSSRTGVLLAQAASMAISVRCACVI